MSCKRFEDQIALFAYGELEDSAALKEHLGRCAACRKEFALFGFAADAMHDLPSAPEPSLTSERLRQAILSKELKQQRLALPIRFGFAGAGLAAMLAVWITFSNRSVEPEAVEGGALARKIFAPKPGPIVAEQPSPAPAPPETVVAQAAPPAERLPRTTKPSLPRKRNKVSMPDLLAVSTGAVRSAATVFAEAAPVSKPAASAADEVVIIQPSGGSATEMRSPDALAIGG